jgi:polyisoprenoid-binding protein YceI
MKQIKFFALATVATALIACNNAAEKEVETTDAQEVTEVAEAMTYNVASESKVMWKGYKTNVDWSHNGYIMISDGSFDVKEGNLVGGSFTIDMGTIVAEDFLGNEKYDDLIGHLNSPDFFDVATYPTAKFEITGVKENASEEGGTSHLVMGNLTMRDQTNNITFPANVKVSDTGVELSAPEFGIDRTKWDVMFHSTGDAGFAELTKDQLIDDTILLWLDVKAPATEVASN